MPSSLQQIADTITQAAGWKQAAADERGVFHFALDGDLDFDLLSPDGRTAFLCADLGAAPLPDTPQGADELRRLSGLAAGALKKRRTIFSISGSDLQVHRSFAIATVSDEQIRLECRDFINDLAWWKKQITGKSSIQSPSSPFNFGGWTPGMF